MKIIFKKLPAGWQLHIDGQFSPFRSEKVTPSSQQPYLEFWQLSAITHLFREHIVSIGHSSWDKHIILS